jgi:hypothetical protein
MIHRPSTASLQVTAWAFVALAAACSGKVGDDHDLGLGTKGGTAGTAASAGGTDTTGTGGVGSTGAGNNGSGATGGTQFIDPIVGMAGGSAEGGADGSMGDGTPEVCDGVDNDHNGIIDDVDAGHDGVCDCLNIGTIGRIGPWSNGGDVFASWLDARTPQGAVPLDDEVLTPELLAPLQVIVVLHVDKVAIENEGEMTPAHHTFAQDEVDAFASWVKKGGGTMTTIGYTMNEAAEVENVNRLLAPVGMGYSTTNLGVQGYVEAWTKHALTDGVKRIRTDNGVEPDGPDGETLAHDRDGHVALQVSEPSEGRVVVWGDEWITYDSEWADVKDQQVELFWLNILKWLSPPKTCQVPIPPGIVR